MVLLPRSLLQESQALDAEREANDFIGGLTKSVADTFQSVMPKPAPAPTFPVIDDSILEQPVAGPEPAAAIPRFELPDDESFFGLREPTPESKQSPYGSALTTLGGTPEAEAVTQPGGGGYVAPQGGEIEAYIRQAAANRGIDPEIAVRVAMSEGGVSDPVRQSDYVNPQTGKREESYGPFQLYMGGGLGNAFQKATGKSPSDPSAWQQGVDFALDEAARGGWGPWYGAARVGIGNRQGLESAKAAGIGPATSAAPSIGPSGELTPNQFTAGTTLSEADAYAACGPAAAVAFARRNGRNPTLDEAVNLARQVGWTPQQGMAGPASQVKLLERMGVASRQAAPDADAIAQDVQRGNPVIVDTPGHYFVAERYDASTGKFDWGNSAKALKASGGNTWYSLDEISRLGMGAPRTAIFMDSPQSPSPSVVAGSSQRIKGVNPERALAEYAPMAQLDLSGMPGDSNDLGTVRPDLTGDGTSPTSPPARDDYRLTPPPAEAVPSATLPPAPGGAVEPEHAQAPASSGEPLDPWHRVGNAIRDALTGVNNAAVGALNAGADAIGTVMQRGREEPSPSQQIANVGLQGLDLSRKGFQNLASDVTGGLIPEGTSNRTPEGYRSTNPEAVQFAEDWMLPTAGIPEVRGLARTSQEALDRLGRAGRPLEPSPAMGIVSRAQAEEAAPVAMDRYYHGTGSDFAKFDPERGTTWMTKHPDYANEFANDATDVELSMGRRPQKGGNVRPIDVPQDLRILNPDNEADQAIIEAASNRGAAQFPDSWLDAERVRNTILAADGYDGIGYRSTGSLPGTNDTLAIFPESLDKIRNATAGTRGGLLPERPRDTAGQPSNIIAAGGRAVGVGVGAGYEESQREGPEGETPEERFARIARSTVGGAATSIANSGTGALLRPGRRPPPPAGGVLRAVPEWAPRGEEQTENLPTGARPIVLSTNEEIARLRLDKFPEEARDDILQAAKNVDWAHAQRRGVLSDDVVAEMAEDLARRGDAWIRNGRAGRAYSPEETVALRNLVTGQAIKVRDLSEEIATARSAGSTPDILIAQRAAEATKLEAYTKIAEGARAEAGRTLRQYATETRIIEADPQEAIQRIYRRLGGRDNAMQAVDEYTKLVNDGADPFQMARFWSKVEKPPPSVSDWFTTLRYNSMLSGPRTFEINTIGSLTEIPWRLARDIGASTVRGRPEEIAPELTGLWVGAQKGARAFMETLQHGITLEQAARGDLPRDLASRVDNRAGKAVATTLEAPGRLMQATDEWARQTAYSMALYREAAIKASREGLRGAPWSQRIAQLVEDSPKDLIVRAHDVADRMTYHNDMGRTGRALGEVQRVPYLGNIVMPFLRTVYNITARGIDRSPVGAAGTLVDIARGAYNEGKPLEKGMVPLGERISDNAVGTAIWMFMLGKVMEGNVSGAGPDDPEKREMLRAQGWQPYSVKVGDNWVSYSNWGPIAIPFAMAAATGEEQLYRKPDASTADILTEDARRFAELATEQTYLQGIGAFYKAIKEPDVYGSQWLSQFMQTLVPFGSAINTAGQATDPVQRRPDRGDIGQAMASRFPDTPGDLPIVEGRTSVPPQQDVLGRDVPSTTAGASAFNPLRVSGSRIDPVIQAFSDVGVDLSKPPQDVSLGGGRMKLELTPDEQRTWQRARGEFLLQFSDDVSGTEWQSLPVERRAKVLRDLLANSGEYARRVLLSDLDRDPGKTNERMQKSMAGVR